MESYTNNKPKDEFLWNNLPALVSSRMGFCTSVDFRFWLLRFSGVRLTVPQLHEPRCSRGGGLDSKDYLQKVL